MKKFHKMFKGFSLGGLVVISLFLLVGLVFMATVSPKSAIASLWAAPFVFGAIKVRDDMGRIRTIQYTHSGATVTDTVYLLNGIVMLAQNSAALNVENVFVVSGLIEYAKTSAQAWVGGDKIYWDNGAGEFTTVATANTLAGYAAEAAANPSSTGLIVLDPKLESIAAGEIVLASAKMLVGNASGVGAAVDLSGDVTIDNAGAVTIGAEKVTAAKTAIADGKIFVGGAGGAAAEKTPSGVLTMTNEAVFSLTSAASPLANSIADPGDGVAIPVTASGVIPITTAAAETNILAAPPAIGMLLVLTCDVYAVGDRVITCATTVNQTGNNTLTFGAAGDTIMLYSTQIGGALRWRVASNDGVALSTV